MGRDALRCVGTADSFRLLVVCSLSLLLCACRERTPASAKASAERSETRSESRSEGGWDGSSRRFALVMGHNQGAAGRLPLRFAETDAQRMAVVLREIGNFVPHNVRLLRAPSLADVRSSLTDIALQIQAWRRERVSGTGPGRAVLLVYFSGHSDGKVLELGGERLEHGEFMRWIAGAGADLRVIVVDACRSGTLLTLKGGAPGPDFRLDEAEASTGHAILASTGADEDALESAELGGSFFSHHLLSGLRGAADANRDGRVSLSEAYAHAAARTAADTTGTVLGPQRPAYQIHLSGRGDFVLTELRPAGTTIELPTELDRLLVIDAIRGTVAAEWVRGSTPRLAVPAVPLVLRGWRGGRTLSFTFSAAPGKPRKIRIDEFVPEPAAATGAGVPPSAAAAEPRDELARNDAPLTEGDILRAFSGDAACRARCVVDGRAERATCPPPFTVLSYARASGDAPARHTLAVDLPSRRSLLRLRFEVCDPQGMWLNVGDSPTNNGAGGDAGNFSNDAELELRASGLWIWANDYGRPNDLVDRNILSEPGFVATTGCTQRTIVLADRVVRSAAPPIRVVSEHALRLDPPTDHEGPPDRRFYIGLNRSIGSDRPDRVGSGLAWVETCVD